MGETTNTESITVEEAKMIKIPGKTKYRSVYKSVQSMKKLTNGYRKN
jgi:hypothetical protein